MSNPHYPGSKFTSCNFHVFLPFGPFSLPRVSCLNPLLWESHLVPVFYFTLARCLGRTTCVDVIEMIETFLDRGRIVGE